MEYSRRPKSKAEFIAGADYYPPDTPTEPVELAAVRSTGFDSEGLAKVVNGAKPWEGLDPKGVARNDFHLRLNDHDVAILRHLADENEDLSMQKIARRILVPELRRRVGLED